MDYLGEDFDYSIDPLPSEPWVTRYTDGGGKKQYQFAFTSKEEYDGTAMTEIENSGFYQAFAEWVESQNEAAAFDDAALPVLENERQTALAVEVMTSGYLFDAGPDRAKYQIQCRLIYEQEAM